MPSPKDKEPDFKEVRKGPLGGRVYKDGRVIIGASVGPNSTEKIEVEISTDTRTAREFLEAMIGLVNNAEGRY